MAWSFRFHLLLKNNYRSIKRKIVSGFWKHSVNHAQISITVLVIKQRTNAKTANNFDACHPIHIHI